MRVPAQIHEAMVAHAQACEPEEACGLFASDADGALRFAYCLTNIEHSATSYTVDPVEHFHAMKHAEANGWELAGAFHSHPGSVPVPSASDVALATEPEWIYVIVSGAEIRAFRIRGRTVTEEPVQLAGFEPGDRF